MQTDIGPEIPWKNHTEAASKVPRTAFPRSSFHSEHCCNMDDFQDEVQSDEQKDDEPTFVIVDGATYYKRKKEKIVFGDFYMKFLGEIVDSGHWVCSFGAKVLGVLRERRIVIPASAFDSKTKFLENTRKSFGGGTFNVSEASLLETYYSFLKEEYSLVQPRAFYAAECIGLQRSSDQRSEYWCLSSEVHIQRKQVLSKEEQAYFFLDDKHRSFEVFVQRRLLQDKQHLKDVCKRFIECCAAFGVNELSVKLATAFVILRLLRIKDEESWNESAIALLYSPIEERNVGKSLTMDILAKGQGVQSRRHPTMLAGGDQNQSGASVPVIRDTMTHTNLVVMVDDPIISANMSEMLLQVQSGLTMGSRTGGVSTSPGGSILLTSNNNVVSRAEGRVLVFQYSKRNFSVQDEKRLEDGVKAIASEHTGFLLAWVITFKETWKMWFSSLCEKILIDLKEALPDMQPRWCKGMAAVLSTHAIFHGMAGINPFLGSTIIEVIQKNKKEVQEDVMVRLQRSIVSKLDSETHNVLTWLNPSVKVPLKGSKVPAIGIRSTTIECFGRVSVQEVYNRLKSQTDGGSTSIYFAAQDECTMDDIQKREKGKTKSAKGWKIPISFLAVDVLQRIADCCGLEQWTEVPSDATLPTDPTGSSPEEQLFEKLGNKYSEIDANILEHFMDNAWMEEEQDLETGNPSLQEDSMNLTPRSRQEWDNFSPRSKVTFQKGFQVAQRILNASFNADLDVDVIHAEATPSTSGESDKGAKKRLLFPEGTIGVLARQAPTKNEATTKTAKKQKRGKDVNVCKLCAESTPPSNKKTGKGKGKKSHDALVQWVQCDICDDWFHLSCVGLKKKPEEEEEWECRDCKDS